MEIHGHFDYQNRPYVTALVKIFSPKQVQENINFLIDTASPYTILSVGDLFTMHLKPTDTKDAKKQVFGIGGAADLYYLSDVDLHFKTITGETGGWKLSKLYVIEPNVTGKKNFKLVRDSPSILGSDFLSLFSLYVDKTKKIVSLAE